MFIPLFIKITAAVIVVIVLSCKVNNKLFILKLSSEHISKINFEEQTKSLCLLK